MIAASEELCLEFKMLNMYAGGRSVFEQDNNATTKYFKGGVELSPDNTCSGYSLA